MFTFKIALVHPPSFDYQQRSLLQYDTLYVYFYYILLSTNARANAQNKVKYINEKRIIINTNEASRIKTNVA
jgi:hypothetical protein